MQKPILIVLAALWGASVGAQDYSIPWHTTDSGGEMFSAGGAFELSGTIGQPDASGVLLGGNFAVTGGFWFPQTTGDCNYDGSADLLDLHAYAECMTGPTGGIPAPACACFDFDHDNDIDLLSFAQFQVDFGK